MKRHALHRICVWRYIWILILSFIFPFDLAAYENSVYVWQRNWNPSINQSIQILSPQVKHFAVLGGDFKYKDEKLSAHLVDIDWTYLKHKDLNVVLVFRMSTSLKKLLPSADKDLLVTAITDSFKDIIQEAKRHGVLIGGMQLDYDCPTKKLKDYKNFVRLLRQKVAFHVSITALPTWLNSREFAYLAKETSYYVLQLHSFETPKNIESDRGIFLKKKSGSYLSRAIKIGHPFYVSLPTYGYEVAFDAEGDFVGFRAETSTIQWEESVQSVTEMTSVKEIMAFLKQLQKYEDEYSFRGVYWFRLPVGSDEFNWDIKTLKAVLDHREPRVALYTELRKRPGGLYELYIINNGERNVTQTVDVNVHWPMDNVLMYDVLEGYQGEVINHGNGLNIEGTAPRVNERKLVAWLRNMKDNKPIDMAISPVRVHVYE